MMGEGESFSLFCRMLKPYTSYLISNQLEEVKVENYIVEMRNITKEFPGIIANDNITLNLKKGEVHALLGENGAGKSTLMSVLFGLYKAEKGEIRINGKTVHRSATAIISFSLWVMNKMDLPSSASPLIISNRSLISCGVKTAVGSSKINISFSR